MKHCEALCISMQNISGNVYHFFFLQQMSMPMIPNDTTVKIARR